jgi:hypothetical protein
LISQDSALLYGRPGRQAQSLDSRHHHPCRFVGRSGHHRHRCVWVELSKYNHYYDHYSLRSDNLYNEGLPEYHNNNYPARGDNAAFNNCPLTLPVGDVRDRGRPALMGYLPNRP